VRHSPFSAQGPAFSCKDTDLSSALPTQVLELIERFPRRLLALIALGCIGLLAFGLYLQHVVGLEPCPMCIVQRYALVLVALVAAVAAALPGRGAHTVGAGLMGLLAVSGAFVAARQSWLQWNPPEILSCGRDFFGMIESFPLKRAIPMIFKGSGDCSAIDWTFLGLTIANWSFLCFSLIALLAVLLLVRRAPASA
jgi:disulfide bond formation protein DsbB